MLSLHPTLINRPHSSHPAFYLPLLMVLLPPDDEDATGGSSTRHGDRFANTTV